MKRSVLRRGLLTLLLPLALVSLACAYFDFTQSAADYESVSDTLPQQGNLAPTVGPVEAAAFSGAALTCRLRGEDPESDPIIFVLEGQPDKGRAAISGSTLTYIPADKARGRDVFSYRAVDTLGNLSQPATITVEIEAYKGVPYDDLAGDPQEQAVLHLTQQGVLTGRAVGQSVLFEPRSTLSRNQFVALAVATAGLEPVEGPTSFLDDDELAIWAKPYVAAAERAGAVLGYPAADGTAAWRGEQAISAAEAAVILQRLGDGAATALTVAQAAALEEEAAPAWAGQALASIRSVPGLEGLSARESLTRSAAAGACWSLLGRG